MTLTRRDRSLWIFPVSWRLDVKILLMWASLALIAEPLSIFVCPAFAGAQSLAPSSVDDSGISTAAIYSSSTYGPSLPGSRSPGFGSDSLVDREDVGISLPAAPEPADPGGNPKRESVSPAADWRQPPFSRIGIGTDVSPLGIGIKSAIILNRFFDARVMGNFFNYNSARFEVEGYNMNLKVHLASAAASLDWYPFDSMFRLSAGAMFYNTNQISMTTNVVPGTSFALSGTTFFSPTANAATGATPLAASGALGLNTSRPAATITGGFGRFIPGSNRHWSFPSELGVAFTGAPSINVNPSGWVCLDYYQTQCSSTSDPVNPVGIEFRSSLQTSLISWRKSMSRVPIYPILSFGVMYSFNIR